MSTRIRRYIFDEFHGHILVFWRNIFRMTFWAINIELFKIFLEGFSINFLRTFWKDVRSHNLEFFKNIFGRTFLATTAVLL